MRKLILVCLGLLITSCAWADGTGAKRAESAVTSTDVITIPAGGTMLNYSKAFPVNEVSAGTIGVMYRRSSSSGTVSITFEQSYKRPDTEGTTDTAYLATNINTSISDSDWRLFTVDTVVMQYGRFRVQGLSAADNTTAVQIKIVK